MDIEKVIKILAVSVWLSSTVYFCHTSVTRGKMYFQEKMKMKMLVYKQALKEHDSLEVEKSKRFLEENKYYDKPMFLLLFISCGWGILVGTGTYAAGWGIYFIFKRPIFGFSDEEQTSF